MFIRLFVSLLLLSALTSEAMAGFPGEIYHLLYPSGAVSLLEAQEPDPEELGKDQSNSGLFCAAFSRLTSSVSFKTLSDMEAAGCSKNPTDDLPLFQDASAALLYVISHNSEKDVIIGQSDVSPPELG